MSYGSGGCGQSDDCQKPQNRRTLRHTGITCSRRCSGWQMTLHRNASGRRQVHARYASVLLYLPSPHLSCVDCLDDKREGHQNCSVLYFIPQLYPIICTVQICMSIAYRCTRACWFRLGFLCFHVFVKTELFDIAYSELEHSA